MNDIHQLIKLEGTLYGNVFPKAYVQGITDKNSGKTLDEILSNFNMYFLSYDGDIKNTRLQVPLNIRKKGLWVTYINLKGNVVTEWYNNNSVEDKDWENSDNWIDGSNMLSGDLAISSEGYWVINGVNTKLPARGKEGITPLLRGFNGKLQVSYNNGESFNYLDLPTFVKEDNEDIKAIIDSNGIKELKFADKAYNPAEFSGLGRVILRKNIIQGKNVLTQEMINKPNTVYEIRYDFDLNGVTINVPENCTLNFDGGSFFDSSNNGCLIGNNTTISTNNVRIFKKGFVIKGSWTNTDIYINWFEVVGDGVIDDSLEFQRISTMISLNGKGNLIFEPNKVYAVKPTEDFNAKPDSTRPILHFIKCVVTLDLVNSTFKVLPNSFPYYRVICFDRCPYFYLKNGTIIGDRLEHDYSPYTTNTGQSKDTHEWGLGVSSYGSKGTIEYINVSQCIGDGFYLSDYGDWSIGTSSKIQSHVTIRNCESSYNRRQGITVGESYYALLEHIKIHHIGTWNNIAGTSPMAGIDIENETSEERRSRYVSIRDVNISDCTVWSVVYGNKLEHGTYVDELEINNCKFNGDVYIHANKGEKRIITDSELIFRKDKSSGLELCSSEIKNCSIVVNQAALILDNCNIYNTDFKGNENLGSNITPIESNFSNCTFSDILGYANTGWPGILSGKKLLGFNFFTGENNRGTIRFYTCIIKNCSSITKEGLVDSVIFNGCEISNSYLLSKEFKFKNSTILNPGGYSAGYGIYTLNCDNCSIIDERKDELPFGGHDWKTFKNCDVKITNMDAETYKNCLYVDFYNCSIEINLINIVAMPKLNFYNCNVKSNADILQFTGIKHNTNFDTMYNLKQNYMGKY